MAHLLALNVLLLPKDLAIIIFILFKALREPSSTPSRLHHGLPNSFNADAISSLHLSKLMKEGNLYFGLLETILRILESEIIFKLPVTICPAG